MHGALPSIVCSKTFSFCFRIWLSAKLADVPFTFRGVAFTVWGTFSVVFYGRAHFAELHDNQIRTGKIVATAELWRAELDLSLFLQPEH